MASATETLKCLHHFHIQLEEARDELSKGPRVIQARKKMILQKQQSQTDVLETIKQIKLAAERKSLDLKILEKKLEDLKAKLNMASSNREFEIIKGQIQADEMAKSVLEDEVLELYEKIDEENAKIPEIDQVLLNQKKDLEKFSSDFQQRTLELEQKIQKLTEELKMAEKFLPREPAEKYERLVASKGSRALAAVNNHACNNCFVQITPQQRILIKNDHILFCTNCGSLLYLEG